MDYGTRNVGLAASDDLGLVVRPLPSIPNRSRRDLLRRVRAIVEEQRVEALVIGLPLNMDGSHGEAVTVVRKIAQWMRVEIGLPLWEVDERLSTVEATEIWKAMNTRQHKKYRTIDSLAAAMILERFLREH